MKYSKKFKITRIAIVDNHPLVCEGVSFVLKKKSEYDLMWVCHSAEEFLEQLEVATLYPEIVLLDISMPNMNGIKCAQILRKEYPAIKIIVLSMHNEAGYIVRMLELDVAGYLTKDMMAEELELALKNVVHVGYYFDKHAQKVLRSDALSRRKYAQTVIEELVDVTPRELDVLNVLLEDLTPDEMAAKLKITLNTFETHRSNLIKKFDAHNTTQVVVKAIRIGLIEP